jgi:hypothetical protein
MYIYRTSLFDSVERFARQGRATVVVGEPSDGPGPRRSRPGPGYDCGRAGCRPHVCHPMEPSTIRGIHGILSGAFAAQRWEWTDRNPAESAKPPTATRQPIPATSPKDVAKVTAEARRRSAAQAYTRGLWWSQARAAESYAACRPGTSTWTRA